MPVWADSAGIKGKRRVPDRKVVVTEQIKILIFFHVILIAYTSICPLTEKLFNLTTFNLFDSNM